MLLQWGTAPYSRPDLNLGDQIEGALIHGCKLCCLDVPKSTCIECQASSPLFLRNSLDVET